jgi:hypothetical protein
MKKIVAIILVLLVLAIIPITIFLVRQGQEVRTKAAPATILSFNPSVLSVSKNESFDIFVAINTGENLALGVDLKISFDALKLEALSIEQGSFFQSPQILANNIDNNLGVISYSIGSFTGAQGSGNIAKITFKAIDSGTVSLLFSQGTAAAAGDEFDILQRTIPATINILADNSGGIGGAGFSNTPTLTPTANPTTTATPTIKPTSTLKLTPTPTLATASPTLSATPNALSQDVPVTGTLLPTILILSFGFLLLLFFFSFV